MKSKLSTRVHFNRVNMQRDKAEVWTAHNSRGCFQGTGIKIVHAGVVVAETVFRPAARQPRAYIQLHGHVEQSPDGTIVVQV